MNIFDIFLFMFLGLTSGNSGDCNNEDIECPEWQEGEIVYIPSPTDCTQYYMCTHSGPVQMNCPGGLWFDPVLNVCNYAQNVNCSAAFVIKAPCQLPWVKPENGTRCYLLSTQKMNFYAAEEFCESNEAILAEPRSASEMSAISSMLRNSRGYNYWIGLTDYCSEGEFIWKSDGNEVTYANWNSNEPSHHGNEDCCHIYGDSYSNKWNDLRCLREHLDEHIMTAMCQQ